MTSNKLSFLTFNIGNPSEQRARRQLEWLASRSEQVLVLTETKASAGCRLLAAAFTDAGWHVTYPVPGPGEYGVMILSRLHANPGSFSDDLTYLPARAASVTLPAPVGPIDVIGAYVPSRDAGLEKTERKKKWLTACQDAITSSRWPDRPAVFLGDLNILEPEYSWVGRTGDGYRYDHAFCSADLARVISDCHYAHEPRADGLSDHSALTMTLAIQAPPELAVTDPAAQPAPVTLF